MWALHLLLFGLCVQFIVVVELELDSLNWCGETLYYHVIVVVYLSLVWSSGYVVLLLAVTCYGWGLISLVITHNNVG